MLNQRSSIPDVQTLEESYSAPPEKCRDRKMAIELDPDFAIAYARLAAVYGNLQQLAPGDAGSVDLRLLD
jgi:hypothetical protein